MSLRRVTPRPHTNTVQRLAARLMRLAGYSLNQIAAVIGFSPGVVYRIYGDVTHESLASITLDELGRPGDVRLYKAIKRAADAYTYERIAQLEIKKARGNVSWQ